jgi:hypothetical protein
MSCTIDIKHHHNQGGRSRNNHQRAAVRDDKFGSQAKKEGSWRQAGLMMRQNKLQQTVKHQHMRWACHNTVSLPRLTVDCTLLPSNNPEMPPEKPVHVCGCKCVLITALCRRSRWRLGHASSSVISCRRPASQFARQHLISSDASEILLLAATCSHPGCRRQQQQAATNRQVGRVGTSAQGGAGNLGGEHKGCGSRTRKQHHSEPSADVIQMPVIQAML